VELDPFWVIMVDQLGHHEGVGKISGDVFLLLRKRNVVYHLVNLRQLLFIHVNF
jgi:hypothetical protein